MSKAERFLNPAEAARRLGVSAKTLRLYEQQGLISPVRTEAGWRTYGPGQMARAAEIVALRRLGFSLKQAGRILTGDPAGLEPALAAHQTALEGDARRFSKAAAEIQALRDALAAGTAPSVPDLARLVLPSEEPAARFALPWPWDGEAFDLPALKPLTYITGPLGSGKTRLAKKIAEVLPGAQFLALDRDAEDVPLTARAEATLAGLKANGAEISAALTILISVIESAEPGPLVIDMVEEGLTADTQEVLIAHLRQRGPGARPLFLMTRSTTILDLDALGAEETILYCPANHSPPILVHPVPGSPGFEAVETCLASPETRARSAGVAAIRPG